MLDRLDTEVGLLDAEIARRAKEDAIARRLMTIPGIGPVTAAALTALASAPETFRCGRDFAARVGLKPVQRSTGGKQKLGQITKAGERTLRRLLLIGTSAVIKEVLIRGAPEGSWLAQMLARKPRMLVGRAGQQDRADRLGALGQRRRLQSSGAGGLTVSSRGVEA